MLKQFSAAKIGPYKSGPPKFRIQYYITIYGTSQDRVKSYFIASAHENSDGMYANSVE